MMIFVDSREPQSLIRKLKDAVGEENVRITKLSYGDYMVVGDEEGIKYVIERKTLRDLKGSIQSGRLWKQLNGLSMYDEKFKKILLLEGMPYLEIKRGYLDWNRWVAWKTAIIEGYGVILYESAKVDETIYFLRKLNERVNNKKGKVEKIRYEIPDLSERDYLIGETIEGEIIGVLIGIKGIGVKSAIKMLNWFGNLRNVFNAKEEDLVALLGEKKGKKVYEVSNKIVRIEEEVKK